MATGAMRVVPVPAVQSKMTGLRPVVVTSASGSEFLGAVMVGSWNPESVKAVQASQISIRMQTPGVGSFWRQPGLHVGGECKDVVAFGLAIGVPSSVVPRRCRAASSDNADVSSDEGAATVAMEETGKLSMVQLGTYFGLWYFYNVIFNIYNKKALNVFPYPWFLATFQLCAGAVWMAGLWGSRLQPCPRVNKDFIKALLLPAFFHTVGHIAACVSFSKVAVSFTHIIKSAEPVFSVAFSSLLGDSYPLLVWASLIPIVFGCGLAAVTELSFNFGGFWFAMLSNFGFVLRNIYSKKSLKNFKEFDGINLYGWITIISILYLAPVAMLLEGSQWVAGYKQAVVTLGSERTFLVWVALSGVFYHLYNQSSYQALGGISPLTFSVGNTMKRVVVIIATVIAFRNPIRPLNALGSAIAILGTFLYSQASAKTVKPKPT